MRPCPPTRLAEVIVVDDASTDATPAEIKALIDSRPLSRPALPAARRAQRPERGDALGHPCRATSPIIATMDGDGQNDPARHSAPARAPGGARAAQGPALVGGVRTERKAYGLQAVGLARGQLDPRHGAARTTARIPAAASRSTGARRSCGCRSSPVCTAICRRCSRPTATRWPTCRSTTGRGRPGVSKYNNLNRALVGIYDLVGVTWLRKRTKVPTIVEQWPDGGLEATSERTGERPRT